MLKTSTNSVTNNSHTEFIIVSLSAISLLIAYNLPWLTSPSTGLTFGAFDLAEWISLHPNIVNMSPALLPTLLLRLIPVYLVILITIQISSKDLFSKRWWIVALFTIALAIALFPPLEILTGDSGNINYRQMMVVSVSTLVAGIVGLSGKVYAWRGWISIMLSILGIVSSVLGFTSSLELYAQFYLPRNLGIGLILSIMGFFMMLVVSIWNQKRGVTDN